jgi:FdhE protein
LRLPDPAHEFSHRQERLQALAAGHPMREYLLFIAAIAGAQQRAIEALTALDLPDPSQLQANIERSGVPLPALGWARGPQWRAALRAMLAALAPELESAARDPVRRLAAQSDAFYESQADRLLGAVTVGLDLAAAPLIAAALQVYWVRLITETAKRFGASIFDRPASQLLCP